MFVSEKGDVHARLVSYYDFNLTQRLILQPALKSILRHRTCRNLKGVRAFPLSRRSCGYAMKSGANLRRISG
ncbi:MAG: copper resistance protein B [Rhodospirillaceae bacterium]|nr:copper resistance protein B [Rhodospirillaceae bacterium]